MSRLPVNIGAQTEGGVPWVGPIGSGEGSFEAVGNDGDGIAADTVIAAWSVDTVVDTDAGRGGSFVAEVGAASSAGLVAGGKGGIVGDFVAAGIADIEIVASATALWFDADTYSENC